MTDFPDLKIKAMVSFPSMILDGTGIDVVKQGGTYQFNLAYDDFGPPSGGLSDPAHQNVLLWNSISQAYTLTPISLFGGGGGIPDAPSDGTLYGRQNATWTQGPTVAYVDAQDAQRAPLASPVFTGDPRAPTAAPGDSDTSIATTAFVQAAITASGGVTPSALTRTSDTNVTLTLGGTPATALLQATSITVGWAGTLAASRGGLGVDASAANGVPLFAAGVPAFTTTTGTGNFVRAISPDLTGGDATSKTQTAGDSSTKIATTAFVNTALANVPLDGTAWTAYTPTVTPGSGAFTAVSATGKYKRIGKTVFITATVSVTTNGTATEYIAVSLPFTSAIPALLAGKEIAVAGNMCGGMIFSGTAAANINQYNLNTYPGANGAIIIISGCYESV